MCQLVLHKKLTASPRGWDYVCIGGWSYSNAFIRFTVVFMSCLHCFFPFVKTRMLFSHINKASGGLGIPLQSYALRRKSFSRHWAEWLVFYHWLRFGWMLGCCLVLCSAFSASITGWTLPRTPLAFPPSDQVYKIHQTPSHSPSHSVPSGILQIEEHRHRNRSCCSA